MKSENHEGNFRKALHLAQTNILLKKIIISMVERFFVLAVLTVSELLSKEVR
jgi:hypothetical protein